MNIWRIHLKTASKVGVDQRRLCIEKGVIGVGWPIETNSKSVTWDSYSKAAQEIYNDRGWKTALKAIKERIQINDLVWTRDLTGTYYLGRITGNWIYETSGEFSEADIVNIRECDWKRVGTEEAVPGNIVSHFRSRQTIQMIKGETASEFSKYFYNIKTEGAFYPIKNVKKDIFDLISTDGCEDALGLYLQIIRNYIFIPSSCKVSTSAYEFELKDRFTGQIAIAQVKSGNVGLNIDAYKNHTTKVFLFSTRGQYFGNRLPHVETIDPDMISSFLLEHRNLLPEKIGLWLDFLD